MYRSKIDHTLHVCVVKWQHICILMCLTCDKKTKNKLYDFKINVQNERTINKSYTYLEVNQCFWILQSIMYWPIDYKKSIQQLVACLKKICSMDFWDSNLFWDALEFHPLQNHLRRPQAPPSSSLSFSYSSSICLFFVLFVVLFFTIFVNFIIWILSRGSRRSTRRTSILLCSSYSCINKRKMLYSYIIMIIISPSSSNPKLSTSSTLPW